MLDGIVISVSFLQFSNALLGIFVDFSRVGRGSGARGNAQTILKEAQDVINQITNLEMEKGLIEQILSQLKKEIPEYYKFVELYYFNNNPIQQVAEEMGYSYNSKKTIYNIKKFVEETIGKYI